jgi:hypothetical protein
MSFLLPDRFYGVVPGLSPVLSSQPNNLAALSSRSRPAASGTRELSATVAACSGGRQVQPVVGGVCAACMFCTRAPIGTQLVSSNASATQRIVLSILVSLRAVG